MAQKEKWGFFTLWGLILLQAAFGYLIISSDFDFDQSLKLFALLGASIAAQLIGFIAGWLFRGSGNDNNALITKVENAKPSKG